MAGIYGAWNFDGRPLDNDVLARMGRALAHRGPDGNGTFVSGAGGVGCRLFRVTPESASEVQPLVRASGVAVVFDGRLDNRRDLVAALRDRLDVSERTPDAELVAAAYEADGADFAARLEGDFAAAVLDLPARRLLLARDALGVRPVYYWSQGGTVVFASEIKAILAHPQVPCRTDERVLAEYMVCRLHRQPEDGHTFFEDVRTVPPAHVVLATPDALVIRRYWDFNTSAPGGPRSFDAVVEGFTHYFGQSVRRRLRSAAPVAVSVSGGLDSSSIFCRARAMRGEGADIPEIVGVTYTSADGSPADESPFVEELERAEGISILRVPLARGMFDEAERSAWHGESPMADAQWNTTRRVYSAVARTGARVLLTGHWGDQMLFDQAYLVDLARRGEWRTIRAHLRAYGTWHPDLTEREFRRFFLSDLAKHQLPPALYRLIQRLKRVVSRTPVTSGWYDAGFVGRAPHRAFEAGEPRTRSAHTRALYQEVRSRYNVHCLEWQNKIAAMFGLESAFPFLDRDLIGFLISVPGEVMIRDGVPKATLRAALQGVVPRRILERADKADFTDVVNEAFTQDAPAMDRLLSRGLGVAHGFVDAGALAAALAEAQARLAGPSGIASREIADLIGLELWLGAFFERETAAAEAVRP